MYGLIEPQRTDRCGATKGVLVLKTKSSQVYQACFKKKCLAFMAAEQTTAITTCFEFSPVLEEVAVALERRDKVKTLFPTTLYRHRTNIVSIIQHSDMNTFGRFEFADEFSSQLCGLFKLSLESRTISCRKISFSTFYR